MYYSKEHSYSLITVMIGVQYSNTALLYYIVEREKGREMEIGSERRRERGWESRVSVLLPLIYEVK